MDRLLLDAAANNFEAAQNLDGEAQMQRILLGLMQMARAARVGSHNALLLGASATNFEDAQGTTGAARMQLVCLGLMQFAHGL